jgi:TolB-like protein/Tfp pilus assembly protein PilF
VVGQAADIALPALNLPDWTLTFVVIVALLGFPVALVLAWAFDIHPAQPSVARPWPGKLIRNTAVGTIVAVAVVLTGFGLSTGYFRDPTAGRAATTGDSPGELRYAKSIAVLPFNNVSSDPENEYFSDGITDDILAQLTRIRDLQVTSRTTAMRSRNSAQTIREIGNELKVAAILEGSVQRSGDKVHIVAQLIDARTDRHLWAETYDRQLHDIFAIQRDVAQKIARALQVTLSEPEARSLQTGIPADPRAYELYLNGRYHLQNRFRDRQVATQKAIEYFGRAVQLEPTYAAAYAAMATAYVKLAEWTDPRSTLTKANTAAKKAVALNDRLAATHAALAVVLTKDSHEWKRAELELNKAIELDPRDPELYLHRSWLYEHIRYQNIHARNAQLSDIRSAQAIDPFSLTYRWREGHFHYAYGELEPAEAILREVLAADPNFGIARENLACVLALQGRHEDAYEEIRKARALQPGEWLGTEALILGLAGRKREALELVAELELRMQKGYVTYAEIGYAYGGIGDADAMFNWFERARRASDPRMPGWALSPELQRYRADERFVRLMRYYGLPVGLATQPGG